jgi:hypothetical protein
VRRSRSGESMTSTDAPGSFAPFRVAAFRALWLAGIVSNIGAWMQTVGAQYVDPDAADMVVEAFTVGSWQEYLNQQADRITEYDREVLDTARAFSSTPLRTERLVAAPLRTRPVRRGADTPARPRRRPGAETR